MSFDTDLAYGLKGEESAQEALSAYFDEKLERNPDPLATDLISPNMTVEVKRERLYFKTNRIAIEYMCNGKPSGISKNSDYFCVLLGDDIYIHDTRKIRDYLKSKRFLRVRGGDGKRVSMFLLTFPEFRECFFKIMPLKN